MRIASGLRAPNPKPSSGVSQRPSGDNLPDHRGSELVDNLLPTHNRISSPVAFVSNRERDNSSDRAILLGDSPCEGSTRSLTIFGLFADLNQPHMVYSGRGS